MSMLTDVNGFWRYDNREALISDENDFKDDISIPA